MLTSKLLVYETLLMVFSSYCFNLTHLTRGTFEGKLEFSIHYCLSQTTSVHPIYQVLRFFLKQNTSYFKQCKGSSICNHSLATLVVTINLSVVKCLVLCFKNLI